MTKENPNEDDITNTGGNGQASNIGTALSQQLFNEKESVKNRVKEYSLTKQENKRKQLLETHMIPKAKETIRRIGDALYEEGVRAEEHYVNTTFTEECIADYDKQLIAFETYMIQHKKDFVKAVLPTASKVSIDLNYAKATECLTLPDAKK